MPKGKKEREAGEGEVEKKEKSSLAEPIDTPHSLNHRKHIRRVLAPRLPSGGVNPLQLQQLPGVAGMKLQVCWKTRFTGRVRLDSAFRGYKAMREM